MAEEVTRVLGKTPAGSEKPMEERKSEPGVALVTKERVPDSYITRVKATPMRKIPPLSDHMYANNPRRRESIQAGIDLINYMVDMEQDCLRQHAEKGHAEIGVDWTSGVSECSSFPARHREESGETECRVPYRCSRKCPSLY